MRQRRFSRRSFVIAGLVGLLTCLVALPASGAQALSGELREYPVNGGPVDITAGPDGELWFTERDGNQIGRIPATGTITEFPLPTANSGAHDITVSLDNQLWFTEIGTNQIGRLSPTPRHQVTGFPITAPAYAIAAGPRGGYLWVAELSANKIGQLR
jgi:virginiamycin B lyase